MVFGTFIDETISMLTKCVKMLTICVEMLTKCVTQKTFFGQLLNGGSKKNFPETLEFFHQEQPNEQIKILSEQTL